MVKVENDRINGILKSRLEEIQTWKKKNADLENALSQMNFMAEEKRMLQEKFNNNIKNAEELGFSVNRLEKENSNLRRFEDRSRELEGKIDALAKEIERLNQILRGKENELNDSKMKQNKMQSMLEEYRNIEVGIRDYENKIALMTQQIDRLNNLIKEQGEDIDRLEGEKIQLHSVINKLKNY